MRDRESRCESAWLLKVDGESKHNSTVHIDDDGIVKLSQNRGVWGE